METPVVFFSSTCEDLKPYREAARDAAISAGFRPEMQEYWAAQDNRPLKVCLEKVRAADVLVAVVAHRVGWPSRDRSTWYWSFSIMRQITEPGPPPNASVRVWDPLPGSLLAT